MELLRVISEAWGWTGIMPRRVVSQNAFGNLIVEDLSGEFWRICPEELSCFMIADNSEQFERLKRDQEFQNGWDMAGLTAEARACFGKPGRGNCFCLKTPAVLGGEYALSNIGRISLAELVSFSGDVAKQIKDLPDGTPVKVRITD